LLACGDGGLGLQEALQFVYYGHLPFQLCIFHKVQRITHSDYLREHDNRGDISRDAGYVLAATEEREVYARLKAFRQKWEPLESASVCCFLRNLSRCLTYLYVDGLDAVQFARTTSHIERTMRELRRKLSQVGTLMTAAGAKATLTLLFAHLNARWNDQPWLLSLTKAALEVA
jgi:transposase-like protein